MGCQDVMVVQRNWVGFILRGDSEGDPWVIFEWLDPARSHLLRRLSRRGHLYIDLLRLKYNLMVWTILSICPQVHIDVSLVRAHTHVLVDIVKA